MNQAIVKGISLYQNEWDELDRIADDRAVNRSAMIRRIIREWKQQQRLLVIGQGHALGMISTVDALQQVIDAAADMPLAIRMKNDKKAADE